MKIKPEKKTSLCLLGITIYSRGRGFNFVFRYLVLYRPIIFDLKEDNFSDVVTMLLYDNWDLEEL